MPRRKRHDQKLLALQDKGTLNPNPSDVKDPLFQGDSFFDPRDLVQVKYEMLRRVRSEGHTVADASDRFGLSRPTFYKAQSDLERDGLAGLLPARRGPHGPHKLTDSVMNYIEEQLLEDPTLDVTALTERIQRRFGYSVHPRSVERALARREKKLR